MLNKLRKIKLGRKGFTLVELLVVIAILGILAAIVIPKLANQTDAARMSQVKSDVRVLDDAMQLYYASVGTYAGSVASLAPYVATIPVGPPTNKSFDNALGTAMGFSGYVLSGSRAAAAFVTPTGGPFTIDQMSNW